MNKNQEQEQQLKSFKRSESTVQKIMHFPKDVYEWLIHDRFGAEHWFGSGAVLLNLVMNYQQLQGALTRKVNGVHAVDKIRVTQSVLAAIEKSWSFFSARGGKIPEGRTVGARMLNALKHPNLSSTQFEFLVLSPSQLLSVYNNIRLGLKAYGIGLKEGEKAYGPEKIRLLSGLLIPIWLLIGGYGHFRSHRPVWQQTEILQNLKPFKQSSSILHQESAVSLGKTVKLVRLMWKQDKALIFSSILNMILPVIAGIESWNKRHDSGQEAKAIMKATTIGITVSTASNIYTFQRIAKSNFLDNKQYADRLEQEQKQQSKEKMLSLL